MSEAAPSAAVPRSALPSPARWAVYGAAWALAFAAMSLYWAAGGNVGASTLSDLVVEPARARDPGFVAVLWLAGALKAIAAVLLLALIGRWAQWIPSWIPRVSAWIAGIAMVLYGAANLAVRAVMAVGLIPTPAAMHSRAATWHLLLWDPWWLLGGIFFTVAAWSCTRGGTTRHRDA